jgi:predicted nucleic acid-binding protein
MVYVDSSSLLKMLWNEAESSAVAAAVDAEDRVLISVLAEVEILVQLKAAYLGGDYSLPRLRQIETRLAMFRNQPPWEFRSLPGTLFQTALRQHRNSNSQHCRSLDRLHLAAMEELKVSRLMTHDQGQAKAALEAGFEVVSPGRY